MPDFDLRFLITLSILGWCKNDTTYVFFFSPQGRALSTMRQSGREVTCQAVHTTVMKHRLQCLQQEVVLNLLRLSTLMN